MKKWNLEDEEKLRELYPSKNRSEIAEILGKTPSAITNHAHILGLKKGLKKYQHNENYFDEPDVGNCYWAGVLAADGWVRKVRDNSYYLFLAFKSDDVKHIQKFADDIKYTGNVKIRKGKYFHTGEDKYTAIVEICSATRVVEALQRNFNIVRKKSLILQPPNLSDVNHKLAFIKGYLDGDGCIRFDKGRLEVSFTGTFDVLNWIQSVFDEIVPPAGKMRAKARRRKTRKVSDYKITGARAFAILQKIMILDIPGLERKWEQLNGFELKTKLACHQAWYKNFGGK